MARLRFAGPTRGIGSAFEVTSVIAQSVSWIRQRDELRAVVVINPEVLSPIHSDGYRDEWQSLPMPVVVALRGTIEGYGLLIALDADVRFAALDTQLSFAGIELRAALRMLGDKLSLRHIEEVRPIVLGGHPLTSQQAYSAGLVSQLVPDPLVLAEETVQEICRHDPVHVRSVKQLLNRSTDMSYADCVAAEVDLHRKISRRDH